MSIDIPSNCWEIVKLNILQRDILIRYERECYESRKKY